jgi:hypothetical protein
MVSQIMCEKNEQQKKMMCVKKRNMPKPQMPFKPFFKKLHLTFNNKKPSMKMMCSC